MGEIGSGFYNIEKKNKELFLSGRSAEDYIIRDAIKQYGIKRALLPSYCCHTMIEPFVKNCIEIRFFDVYYDEVLKVDLPEPLKDEVVLYLKYYGYSKIEGLDEICNWNVKIEDQTHSAFVNNNISDADYTFISYRKWTGFSGFAEAKKKNGQFIINRKKLSFNDEYENVCLEAMRLKEDYLQKNLGKKQTYLDLYKKSETILSNDYVGYRPSYNSLEEYEALDIDYLKRRRRENASYLLNMLSDTKGIIPLYTEVLENDVPLNVPVLVDKSIRDELHCYLIKHEIYCPIHWPISDLHLLNERSREVYDRELSLIIDQRYDIEDMQREVAAINSFFEKMR